MLVNTLLVRRLPAPFAHEGGHCWSTEVPRLVRLADDADNPRRSTLALYEDGVPLMPAHTPPEAIRRYGRGRYAHRGREILFAASDNSDPNTNGRDYTWSASPWLFRRRVGRWGEDAGLPVNQRRRDAAPEQVRADVDYTLKLGEQYLAAVLRDMPSLRDKTVLEVGPGINDGCALFLAAFGARPMVLDRFLAPWDAVYHPAFYSLLREEMAARYPDADTRPISALLDAGGYPDDVSRRVEACLEEDVVPAESVDVVFSNAVVEHLYDPLTAFGALHRMTRPGGVGLHQVDFRDHRDFARPLEFLLAEEEEFCTLFGRSHGQVGNRLRPDETADAFRTAGFLVVSFLPNDFVDPEYLKTFVPRLRAATASRFRDRGADRLRTAAGFFRVRKPAA
jgi:hypothetical protein